MVSLKVELTRGNSSPTSKGHSQDWRSLQEQKTSQMEPKHERFEHTVALVDLDPQINEPSLKPGRICGRSPFKMKSTQQTWGHH